MKPFQFRSQLWVPRPRGEVFEFFSSALNLEQITPPWVSFRVITPPPIEMRVGALIDYSLRIRGIPARWQSRITAWEPPYRFVDEQVRGPYSIWIHEHRFTEGEDRTLCEDYVQYAPPGGALFAPLLNALLIERDVRKIFDYRSQRLREIFGDTRPQDTGNGGPL